MALLNKSNTDKGLPANFTLNVEELVATIPEGHPFKDPSSWKLIFLAYQTPSSAQTLFVTMDARVENPFGEFLASPRASETFEIKYITIQSLDNAKYTLVRQDIDTSEIDVVLDPLLKLEDGNFLLNEDGTFLNL